jgi:hypothetical protein
VSNYTDVQEFLASHEQRLNERVKRVRLVLKELLRLLIEECGFPANQIWFAKRTSPGDAVEDPIDAIDYRYREKYTLLLVAEVARESGGGGYVAHVELWIDFGPENITLGTEDHVGMTLTPVPEGGSGMGDLVALSRSAIRKQIATYGQAGSLRDGVF